MRTPIEILESLASAVIYGFEAVVGLGAGCAHHDAESSDLPTGRNK